MILSPSILVLLLSVHPLPARADAPAEVLGDEFLQLDSEERRQFRAAGELFEAGNYPAAAKAYRDFIDGFSRGGAAADARMMLAECLYRQALKETGENRASPAKAFRDAREEYEKALRLVAKGDHLAASAAFRLAEIDFNEGRYKDAVERIEKMQADNPGGLLRGEARLLQGQALLAINQAKEAERVLRAALADQPLYEREPRMQLAYGVALFDSGNSSASLKYLDGLETPIAKFYSARVFLQDKKPLVAIERLRQVLQKDSDGPFAEMSQYLLAEAFFSAKDYLSATQAYEQFLRSYPRSPYRPGATYKIGLCQFERGDYLAARGSFQSVLQLSPSNEFAELSLYMIGESFMKENRTKEANYAYADLASSYHTPLAGSARFKQGWTHYQQGELPAADAALRMMLANHPGHPLAPPAAMLIGNVLARQERYGDAVRAYQQALDMLPAEGLPDEQKNELREAAFALQSRANLIAGDYASLVSGYQYILKHAKPSLSPWRAATLLYIAEGHYRQRFYDEALSLYREVEKLFPAAPEAVIASEGAAWALFSKGEYAQAERERTKLMQYRGRPPVPEMKTTLAKGTVDDALFVANEFEIATSRFNQKKYEEALDAYELFEKTHASDPLAPEAALQAGWAYYRLEHYGQALASWERVQNSYQSLPAAAKAAWAIADTYFRAAHYDKAIAAYERILRDYPSDPASGHARVRIAQAHYNGKDVLKAIGAFEAIAMEAPDSAEATQALDFITQLLFAPESKAPALDALTRIADGKPGTALAAHARFRIARHLYESGDHAAAAQNLEQVIAKLAGASELMDAQFLLAESYYELKKYREAALAYERFTANYAGDKRYAAALFHLGASHFKIEEFAPAADAFSKLAKDFPDTPFAPVALFNSALAYRKLGQWEQAAIALKTYSARHPVEAKSSNADAELAAIYEEHRQWEPLIELLVKQREAAPADDVRRLETTQRLAEAYASADNEAKAIEEYRNAAKSPFKNNAARLAALAKLGEHYEGASQWEEAFEAYQDLAKSASDPAWADAAKARAAALREKIAQASARPLASGTTAPAAAPAKSKQEE